MEIELHMIIMDILFLLFGSFDIITAKEIECVDPSMLQDFTDLVPKLAPVRAQPFRVFRIIRW